MTREEAARTIDGLIIGSDECEEGDYISSDEIEALEMAIEVLKQPEIIRCKDCSISTFDKQTNLFYCNTLDVYKLPEFYCGYARRREE